MQLVKNKIRSIKDFPKKGILFRDITTALKEPETLKTMVDYLYEQFKTEKIDYVAGIESRGFIVGMPLSYLLKTGFVPIRKPNKLPSETFIETYQLEYGMDSIEMHKDAVQEGSKVLIVDDLLATGGTACAACNLIKQANAEIVGVGFWIELTEICGRKKLEEKGLQVVSMLQY